MGSYLKDNDLGRSSNQKRQVVVDIRPLKAFVCKFPKDNPLRDTILRERDILEVHEFLPKIETWLNLSRTV